MVFSNFQFGRLTSWPFKEKIEVVQSLSRKNVIDAYDSDFTCHKFTVSSFLEY